MAAEPELHVWVKGGGQASRIEDIDPAVFAREGLLTARAYGDVKTPVPVCD